MSSLRHRAVVPNPPSSRPPSSPTSSSSSQASQFVAPPFFLSYRLPLLLIVFRVANALVIRTQSVPDEYWQSLEVAHWVVFGYGYLTWEWREKIRSFAHPLLFAGVYKLLDVLRLDQTKLLFLGPKILQGILAGIGEYATYRLADILFGRNAARWTLFSSVISWFNFYHLVRTLSNSMEAIFTALALFYWPWSSESGLRMHRFRMALFWAAISCMLRPTNALVWGFLGLELLHRHRHHTMAILLNVSIIMFFALAMLVGIDYLFYGEILFTPYHFLEVNVFRSISIFYGVHSWHWYVTQGVPVLCLTLLFPALHGIRLACSAPHPRSTSAAKLMVALVGFTVVLYSVLPHKEFRFVHPLLPPLLAFAGLSLSLSHPRHRRYWIVLLVLTQVPMGLYMALRHQRGVLDVMHELREHAAGTGESVGFLMPCHSTPFYASLHKPIPMWFLTCEPPLEAHNKASHYLDEADQFYADPVEFLRTRLVEWKEVKGGQQRLGENPQRWWPHRLVIFEELLSRSDGKVKHLLETKGYRECQRYFNSDFHDDKRRQGDVLLLCRD
ncbi:uncharacterized protein VTP21DRAFT_5619 [Calcarisporiella thermophila]|uniref:uncharacterized protein n=1 Tax=Calcarisporiella thermophila TaxID=911321 RepID=UPI003741F076